MRVVWKDSSIKRVQPKSYKDFTVDRITTGWITNLPGDNNIYGTRRCAMRAIDKYLGVQNVSDYDIHIIGKRTDAS